jgi:hypothetical protein
MVITPDIVHTPLDELDLQDAATLRLVTTLVVFYLESDAASEEEKLMYQQGVRMSKGIRNLGPQGILEVLFSLPKLMDRQDKAHSAFPNKTG